MNKNQKKKLEELKIELDAYVLMSQLVFSIYNNEGEWKTAKGKWRHSDDVVYWNIAFLAKCHFLFTFAICFINFLLVITAQTNKKITRFFFLRQKRFILRQTNRGRFHLKNRNNG